jgi:hypothetical protein
MERRHVVKIPTVVHCRALGDKQLYDVKISAIGGSMQSGQPAFVPDLNVRAPFQQNGDNLGMSGKRCKDKGRVTRAIGLRHINTLIQQVFCARCISILGRIVQRASQNG